MEWSGLEKAIRSMPASSSKPASVRTTQLPKTSKIQPKKKLHKYKDDPLSVKTRFNFASWYGHKVLVIDLFFVCTFRITLLFAGESLLKTELLSTSISQPRLKYPSSTKMYRKDVQPNIIPEYRKTSTNPDKTLRTSIFLILPI
ncbi:unnamed protein product [Clavelina lepadiformis]|uniref:Uncharacterized protein n=1 Tax=Clavelina lepadiformis TaxID=159417 RepID=A0ABP0H6I3_CLALP